MTDALHLPGSRCLAVWRRNLLVWRKLVVSSMVGNFGDPLLYLLALGYGLGSFVGSIDGTRYVAFLAAGTVCSSAMNAATFEALYSAYTRMTMQQTWSGMLATPVDVEDIVFGEILWAATKSAISSVAIAVVASLLGLVHGWQAVLVVPVALLTGMTFAAMALVVTSFAKGYDSFVYYFTLLATPMMLFGGVFFPVDRLPPAVQWLSAALPLHHSVSLVRPLMLGRSPESPALHVAVLAAYAVVAAAIAVRQVRHRLLS